MYVVQTNYGGHFAYFSFYAFLENLNMESNFRDSYPTVRNEVKYCTTTYESEIEQTNMLLYMDIGV